MLQAAMATVFSPPTPTLPRHVDQMWSLFHV